MIEKILLIGPLPKGEAYGVGLGFESLIDGFSSTKCSVKIVDIEGGYKSKTVGAFGLVRALVTIRTVLLVWLYMPWWQVIYMTIASSRLGFLRDALIIWPASLFRKRIVLHLKGGGYKDFYLQQPSWLRRVISLTLARSTHIVVLGELLRDQFDFVPRADEKTLVVPNGLTVGLAAAGTTKTIDPGNAPFSILYLSNLIPSKGYLILLEACAIIKDRGQIDFNCNYCGAFTQTILDAHPVGAEQQKIEFLELIDKKGLSDNVFYHGTVGGSQKQEMLDRASVFVLPTKYPWEGQPISIIEALAFATPVVSSPHKGIPEEVLDGVNGYLVDADDANKLADAITSLASNAERYSAFSAAARAHFEKNFTREVHLQRLMSVICDGEVPSFTDMSAAASSSTE
jgi:glycosyltransferase involved in cell wall biosynthesis